jgi:hypothetical protein
MAKFIIEPHFRLQEWVAEEKGYFRAEGLDYEFRELVRATGGKVHDKGDKVGAFQSFEEGRKSSVSCACHWTVNVAAASGHGRMYSDVRRADLGRLPVGQPLRHRAGARELSETRRDQSQIRRRHAVRAHGAAV